MTKISQCRLLHNCAKNDSCPLDILLVSMTFFICNWNIMVQTTLGYSWILSCGEFMKVNENVKLPCSDSSRR